VLDLNEFTEESIADAAEGFASEQINAYLEAKKSISSFREEIKSIAESIYGQQSMLPLVFIIDELDRCRPPHAVRVLEIVKHLFSIDRVAFVIALDAEQLAHSIRTLYGQGMNVDEYLKRFFGIEFHLPIPSADNHLSALFSRFGLDGFFDSRKEIGAADKQGVYALFRSLFKALDFSFRERERVFSLLSLAIRATGPREHLHPFLLGCLILLKVKNAKLYKDFVNGKADAAKIFEYFSSSSEGKEFVDSQFGAALEVDLVYAQTPLWDQDQLHNEFRGRAQDKTLADEEREQAICMADIAMKNRFDHIHIDVKSIVAKIDLAAGEGE